MKWFFIIVLGVLLLEMPKVGIVVAVILLHYYFFKKSSSPKDDKTSQPDLPQPSQRANLSSGDLADLVLLRLELQSQLAAKHINKQQYTKLMQHIDGLCEQYLARFSVTPDNVAWQRRRDLAWDLLNDRSEIPLGQPPWQIETSSPAVFTADESKATVSTQQIPASVEVEKEYKPTFVLQTEPEQTETQPAVFAIDEEERPSVFLQANAPVSDNTSQQPTLNQYAWKPHEPTRLERALSTLSGWHSMAVPFLVQNIGWFIGIFCFIAGSTFLVHSTEGYASNLIAFFAFFIFTLALLFGGYQLRSKRPELETSSFVIFIISLLLIPLTTITATQLLTSSDSLGLQILSSLLIVVELCVFYFVVTLVSGLMDRSLQHGLPKFFIALTAACTLQPILLGLPFWQVLAVIHLLIVAILSAGIYTYTTQWLKSIFIDQHKIAYFAAGILVYAALVSFISISTRNNISLPDGYVGFFLMVLSSLLFFVDAQFKQWTQQYAHLSRFSFFVYGLSVLALCLVAQYQTACILTLLFALGLYAFIVWRYLTLTPLTIFLGCAFWLYSLLVLQYIPELLHLLASLPILLALHRAARWALKKRQSAYLALIVYRVLYALLASLTVWSLSYSDASLSAVITVLNASTLTYFALQSAPQAIFTPYSKINTVDLNNTRNLLNTAWFYVIPALGVVLVCYAPRFLNDDMQFSIGLLLLSIAWGTLGLSGFFKANVTSPTDAIEQHLNSALLSLLLGLLPLWTMPTPERIPVLFFAGAIVLWLSYKLLSRSLFYSLFILWGAGFALVKQTYFPPPSNGMVTVILGIALWFWLWFIERPTYSKLLESQRERASEKLSLLPSLRVLGWYPLPSSTTLFKDVIRAPLEQLMVLSWLLTMKAVIMRWLADMPSYGWLAAIFLAGLLAGLIIVRYLLIRLLPVPMLLVLSALLMLLQFIGLSTESLLLVSVLYALLVWQVAVYSVARPFFNTFATLFNPLLKDEDDSISDVTHNTAFFIVLSGVILQLLAVSHSPIVFTTLAATAGFLSLSDRSYQRLIVRYLVLGFSLLAVVELVALTVHPLFQWQAIGSDIYAGLLLVVLSLLYTVLASADLAKQALYDRAAAIIALLLAFSAASLQILQATNSAVMVISSLDYSVLLLAGFVSLCANRKFKSMFCNLSAFFLLILATLWLEQSLLHAYQPFSLWLDNSTFADSWLVLIVLSFVMSVLARKSRFERYRWSLNIAANACFAWALLGTLTLFLATGDYDNALPALLLLLLPALFSLSKDWSSAAQVRGLGSACLPTLMLFSLLPTQFDEFSGRLDAVSSQTIMVLFGYALWCCASFLLPRFNQRYLAWKIEPLFFPWIGLLLVIFSGGWLHIFTNVEVGVYFLELSVYCLLMLRYNGWAGFVWLSAFAFTTAGFAFNIENKNLAINLLLWGNLQLLLVNTWQRKGEGLAKRWQWQSSNLAQPFCLTATLVFMGYLLLGSMLWILFIDGQSIQEDTLPIAVLLVLSLWHRLWLRFSTVVLHGFIYALFLLLWSIYFTYLSNMFQPPLLLAVWSVLLFGIAYLTQPYKSRFVLPQVAITQWLSVSLILATASLFSYAINRHDLPELLLALALVACLSAILGVWTSRTSLLIVACVELLVFLHLWPFLWVGINNFAALLPWYALQVIVFACLFIRLLANTDYARYWSWFVALSLAELFFHGLIVHYQVTENIAVPWLFAPWDAIFALITGLIIGGIGVRHVRYLPDSHWLYGIVTLVIALGFYGRLVLLGNAPVSLWDTALLIVFAYGLFFSQRLFASKPLLNAALFMPVLAIFTVPLQLATPETSGTLMLSGLLYAMMQRYTQQKIPLYLALLAFNAGVYLWIPNLVDSSQLMQVYVIPAALSILLLLHLHSRELKPSVLMGSRLAATGTIYACATVDVFLRPELGVFILAMALSVAGILLGIALRTRAFLYTGVSFLLLNVLGQLVRFYPEQGFGKAIVLMVMGATITGAMIWFNIKRVEILQRLNAIQAEMQTWQ